MSKTWKWILGILLVVVVVGAFFAIGFTWRTHTMAMPYANWNGPMMGRGAENWSHPQMWDRNNYGHPMMNYERGFIPFGGFFVLGGFLRFALFIGLLYGAYWLGKRNARIALDPATGSGPAPKPNDQPQG